MKKQLVSAAALCALTMGLSISASAGTYSAVGTGTEWLKTVPQGGNPDNLIKLVTDENGNNSVKISGYNGLEQNVRLNRKIKASGAEYRFSLKYKELVMNWMNNIRVADKTGGRYAPFDISLSVSSKWQHTPIEGTDGWYDSTADVWYEGGENTYLNILVGGWGSIQLDDICVVSSSNELLLYDDFETEIEDVTQDKTSISWTVLDGAVYNELNVYREDENGNNVLVKTLAYGVNTLSADEIDVPFDGTWHLKPVKTVEITKFDKSKENRDVEMDGVTVEVLKDFETGMGVYEGAAELTELKPGTLTVKAFVKNNKVDEGIKAQLITILKKDGKRVASAASDITTAPANLEKTELETSVFIPENETGYELGVYLWDSLEGMRIITPSKIFSQPVISE